MRFFTAGRSVLVTLTLVAALAVAGVALAAGMTTQSIKGTVEPSKLPRHERTGVSMKVTETTGTTDPSGVQPPTASAKIFLDKDIALTTQGLAKCDLNLLAGTTAAEAKTACGDSLVGKGSAVARLSNGTGGHIDIPAKVTAFNGDPLKAGPNNTGCQPIKTRPCLFLHVQIGASSIVVILEITKAHGAYGTKLATVPGNSEPIHSLTLKLHRTFTSHGKVRNYVSARCSHGNLSFKGKFTYQGSPPLTATSTQRCTVKR